MKNSFFLHLLDVLHLQVNNFENKSTDEAFEGLHNLKTLGLNSSLEDTSPQLLGGLTSLQTLDLSESSKVPCDAIPGDVEDLNLSGNRIHRPGFTGCKFLTTLKKLDVGYNGIKSIDDSTFNYLTNLEELVLDGNHIERISNDHFRYLKQLKIIQLNGTKIERNVMGNNVQNSE